MSQNLPGEQPEVQPQAAQPAADYSAQYAQPAAPMYGAAPIAQPKGLAVAAMVLGIAGIVVAWIPGINWLAFPASIVGLILGIIALKKGQPRGMALTGIILGAIALVLAIIATIIIIVATAAIVGAATSLS